MACFVTTCSSNITSGPILSKNKQTKRKFPNFDQNHGLTPLENPLCRLCKINIFEV